MYRRRYYHNFERKQLSNSAEIEGQCHGEKGTFKGRLQTTCSYQATIPREADETFHVIILPALSRVWFAI